jgi:CAAX protease family protein
MQQSPERPTLVTTPTWIGLIIALFAMLVIRQVIGFLSPSFTTAATVWRESLYWLSAVVLLVIVRRGERLPLTSIGIGTSAVTRSLLWGLVTAIACAAIGFAIAALTHFNGGRTGESLARLPVWFVLLIVIRAGVIEELFYRGYAIERLQAVGLKKYLAAAIPLVIFSLGHWRGGWPNIVIALALGTILSGFYLWRRDLVANMIGHFTVDFIGVVLPRLVHHA